MQEMQDLLMMSEGTSHLVLRLLTNQVLDAILMRQRQSTCKWALTAYSKVNAQKEPGACVLGV